MLTGQKEEYGRVKNRGRWTLRSNLRLPLVPPSFFFSRRSFQNRSLGLSSTKENREIPLFPVRTIPNEVVVVVTYVYVCTVCPLVCLPAAAALSLPFPSFSSSPLCCGGISNKKYRFPNNPQKKEEIVTVNKG